MAKYRDPHTGAVRDSSTPLREPYDELVAEEASKEELKQEAQRRASRDRRERPDAA